MASRMRSCIARSGPMKRTSTKLTANNMPAATARRGTTSVITARSLPLGSWFVLGGWLVKRPATVLTGQGFKEADEQIDLGALQCPAELFPRHYAHRRSERGGAAVMKIRRRQSDIAQTRHPEYEAIALLAGDLEAPEIALPARTSRQRWC